MDPYEGFAERYDLSFGLFGEPDMQEVEFFRRIFGQNQVQTVLDCACGTGRHLPLFHSLGCKVVGSDISEAMLTQAKINLAESGLEIPLHQTDFRHLPGHFPPSFDAVVCLAAIGFMPSEEQFQVAFKSMAQVLRPGGVLILTAMPTDRQWNERPRFMLTTNTPNFSRLFAIDYSDHKALYHVLDVFHGQGIYDLKIWSAELHVLLRDDQEKVLKAAGFRSAEFYGSYDFSPFDKETSNSMITVAYK